jgi:hypothetical protein
MSVSGVISNVLGGNSGSSAGSKISAVNSLQTVRDDSPLQLAIQLSRLTVRMQTIEEVLVKKQIEFIRVGKELDALRLVAPLLESTESDASEVIEPPQPLTAVQLSPTRGEAAFDLHPAVVSWFERWREATNRSFLMALIKRRS